MSGLTFNKIAGAVLATALGVVGLHEVSGMVFEPDQTKKPGYKVEVALEEGSGPAVPEALPDWGTVLPMADAAKGADTFSKCTSCHKPTEENGTGPGLNAVVGRAVASHPGFAYSDAMKGHTAVDPKWTYDALFHFLKKPGGYVPGTKMTFVGLKDPQDRINVIAYLHTLSSSLPIPAPDPSRAPGAAPAAGGAAPAGEGAPAATSTPGGTAAGVAPPAGAAPGSAPTAGSQVPGAPVAGPAPGTSTTH